MSTAFDINKQADQAVKELVGELPTQVDDTAYAVALIYSVLTDAQKSALQADPRFSALSVTWAAVGVIRANAAAQIASL